MRAISLIFRRELGAYLRTPLGWVIASIALLIDGLLFRAFVLAQKRLSSDVLSEFFRYSCLPMAIAAVALAMPLFAREREQGTIVLYNTSPVRDVEMVLGKFLAAFVFLSAITLASAYLPAMIMVKGKVAFAQVIVGYIGLLLWGGAILAMGVFASALTHEQIVAGIVGAALAGTMVCLFFIARVVDPPLQAIISGLDLYATHYPPFQKGVLHLKNIVYYVAVTFFFLLLAVKTLEAKRWT